MKKLLTVVVMSCSLATMAQQKPGFRLNVYTNYVFDDRVDSYYSNSSYYEGKIKGGFQWGVGAEFMLRPTQGIEISYLRQDTKAPTTYYDNSGFGNSVKNTEFDLAVNYIMIGSTRYFPVSPKVEPYFGGQLGVGIVDVSNPARGSEANATEFAWGIKGGANFWVSEKVGIKFLAGLNSITQAVGGGVYFGTGGVGAGLSSYSSLLQFSLGGGLVFKFGGGQK